MNIHIDSIDNLRKLAKESGIDFAEHYIGDIVQQVVSGNQFLYLCMGQNENILLDVEDPTNSYEDLIGTPDTFDTNLKGWLEIKENEKFPWPKG